MPFMEQYYQQMNSGSDKTFDFESMKKADDLPKGVTKHRKKFVARLSINGKQYHLGTFDTVEQATAMYQLVNDKKMSDDKNPSFDIQQVIKEAKKAVVENALGQTEEKGNGEEDAEVEDATVSTASMPKDDDNDDDDDDDTFPVANDIDDNGDDGEDASTLDREAERIAKAQARIRTRSRYDFSTANLKKTAPLYKNDLFRLEDDNEQPLMCELASLHREAAIHFIDTMKRKPDGFWLDESVTASAAEAFWFHLPPRVLTEEARHLYRNFAD
jgi:hypothetical protein